MLGLSIGTEETGNARLIVEQAVGLVEGFEPAANLAAVYVLTSILDRSD